jgi:hypothetical protein
MTEGTALFERSFFQIRVVTQQMVKLYLSTLLIACFLAFLFFAVFSLLEEEVRCMPVFVDVLT